MTVCVFKAAKKKQKFEANFSSERGFFCSFWPHFFFHLRQVCVFVLLLKILFFALEYEGESAWGSLSYSITARVIKRREGVLFD